MLTKGVSDDGSGGGGPTPTITVDAVSLSFPNTGSGQTSAAQSYHVSGINLVGNIIVIAPTGYIVNLDGSTTNASPINLVPAGGTVASTQIYVRFKPGSIGSFNDVVQNTSSGAASKDVAVTGLAPVPTVSIIPSSLSFADTIKDDYSAAQSYSVSGQYLVGNIVITAPAGFIINQDGSSTNTSPITLVQVAGTVGSTTIYVKFHPTAVQAYSDNVANATTSGPTVNLGVSGMGTTPAITSSIVSISGLSYQQEFGPSAASTPLFSFSGVGLLPAAGNITFTPSSNIEIWDGISAYQSSAFTVAYTGGTIFSAAIYKVRLKAGLAEATYAAESVTISGGGAIPLVIPVSGAVTARPLITVSDPDLFFPDTETSGYSASQTYTVTGANMVNSILIQGVTGFIVNLDNSDVDATPITLPVVGTSIGPTTIYVKFNPILTLNYTGSIQHTSLGAVQKNVTVDGTGTPSVFERMASYYHAI